MKQCPSPECGLAWLDPAPLEADLLLLYRNYYTHAPAPYQSGQANQRRAFIYGIYLRASYIPSALLGVAQERHRLLHMHLQDSPPGRLLDVGCGDGGFLKRMSAIGWVVAGVDFDAEAIENAKAKCGGDLRATDLAGAQFPKNSFDAVTLNHVIEHVPDPVALLAEARRVLKQGGRLIAATQNVQSLGHVSFRDCWCGLDPPRHLQVFSVNALKNCARQAGFGKVSASTSTANADSNVGASFRIQEAKRRGTPALNADEANMVRGLRSLFFQYRETVRSWRRPELGEEAVLLCHK
jgi:SAM-dependent methyltransferase